VWSRPSIAAVDADLLGDSIANGETRARLSAMRPSTSARFRRPGSKMVYRYASRMSWDGPLGAGLSKLSKDSF